MNRIDLEINPFTKEVLAIGSNKQDKNSSRYYVEDFIDRDFKFEFLNQKYIVFINYNGRLEASCFKMDDTGMVLDEPVLTKVKIVLTDKNSTFI